MGKNSCASGICSDNRNFWYHLAFTVLLYLYCPDTFFCRWCMCFASTSVYKSVYCGSVIIQKSCLLSFCVYRCPTTSLLYMYLQTITVGVSVWKQQ